MITTEQDSRYNGLEKMSVIEVLSGINHEDHTVPDAVAKAIPQIAIVVETITERMKRGGRVFYMGAGTSGRIGITDASEIPPTYGVAGKFIGIIAGGDDAIRNAKEGAEDNRRQGSIDILDFDINENDTVSTYEMRFGDNDTLSALVASLTGADLLILLSDIDGLYTDDPHKNPEAEIIPDVYEIDENILGMAKGSTGSNVGTTIWEIMHCEKWLLLLGIITYMKINIVCLLDL